MGHKPACTFLGIAEKVWTTPPGRWLWVAADLVGLGAL